MMPAPDRRSMTSTASPHVHSEAEPAERAPARRCRTGGEIQLSLTAVVRLARCGDARVEALGKGGYHAARWIGGQSALGPVSGVELPEPTFDQVASEIETAGRVAAGVEALSGSGWCDEARIAARGVEEWLAWVHVPGYPIPLWVVPDMPLAEIRSWVLGQVGCGPQGLLGPGVSVERFPYDVADILTRTLSGRSSPAPTPWGRQ